MIEFLTDPTFWTALLMIIGIDILLGGDNAVLIALACRKLPPDLQRKAIWWGTAGAVGLRVVFLFFAAWLLTIPGLQLVSGVALLWIAFGLLKQNSDSESHGEAFTFMAAIKTIIAADALMSVENVIAMAGAAHGNSHSGILMVLGVLISIPIVVYASKFVLVAMERFPIIIYFGAVLLAWIGVGLIFKENWSVLIGHVQSISEYAKYIQYSVVATIAGLMYWKYKKN